MKAKRNKGKTPKQEKHFRYLDALRDSGITNMFGAGSYLENAFNLKRDVARNVLADWMRSFDGVEQESAK